jgi:UDP-N-acetylmuramate dehydrogenase
MIATDAKERVTSMEQGLAEQLRSIAPTREGEPLARHTTFGIGGPADIFVTVRSADEMARVVRAARAAAAPVFVLGSGSNILIGDAGIRGVVIDNQAKAVSAQTMSEVHRGEVPGSFESVPPAELVAVRAESGMSFAALARQMARSGYAGIEWACGIPGSMGGAVVYNAGAYEGSLADVLLSASVLQDDIRSVPAADLRLSYRSSALLRGELPGAVVLSVEIALRLGDAEKLTARIAELDKSRLNAQPRGRNGGSTFKNPPGKHAWELIDAVGLRGHRIGDARISPKHCNFFENLGAATAADVYALMQEAQKRVRDQFGIEMENEIQLVGEGF